MRVLPATGQETSFLESRMDRPGVYHHVRLLGALLLTSMGVWLALGASAPWGLPDALLSLGGALLALSSLAYLAGTFLPFSRSRTRLWLRRYALLGDRILLRVILRHARLVGDKTDPILRSFVRANNAAVRALYRYRKPGNVMVLLPHCVVYTRCPKKVVKNLAACKECDLCQMEEILGLSDRASLPVGIAIRSVEAYSQARGLGPDLTLAVACDDRLVKGITRVPELPAFGLPLHLPKESCHNNLVDLAGLKTAVRYFLGTDREAGRIPAAALPQTQVITDQRRIRLPVLAPPHGPGHRVARPA